MRSLKWTLALLFFALLTFGGVGHAGDAPRPAFAQDADAELYPVHIGDQVAFRLGPSGDETAKQRAGGAVAEREARRRLDREPGFRIRTGADHLVRGNHAERAAPVRRGPWSPLTRWYRASVLARICRVKN